MFQETLCLLVFLELDFCTKHESHQTADKTRNFPATCRNDNKNNLTVKCSQIDMMMSFQWIAANRGRVYECIRSNNVERGKTPLGLCFYKDCFTANHLADCNFYINTSRLDWIAYTLFADYSLTVFVKDIWLEIFF